MALTQIRDIAFAATEPQNKYNLWLHFKEKKALVLEMWINGAWREVNSFWGTEGNINPDPGPSPEPTPEQVYPVFDLNNTDGINVQVLEDIDSRYLPESLGTPDYYVNVILTGITNFSYDSLQYETNINHSSIGTFHRSTNTIVCTEGFYENIFTINSSGNITLERTINLNKLSSKYLLRTTNITEDISDIKLIDDFNPLYYSEIQTFTTGVLSYTSYFKEEDYVYKNIIIKDNPKKIVVTYLIWNLSDDSGYFTKRVEQYDIENNCLLGFALYNLAESYSAHIAPYDQDYYNYVKNLSTYCYYASKSINNCPFTFSKATEEVTLSTTLSEHITFSCPTYTITVDNNNKIKFWIGLTEFEGTTYYYPKIEVTLNNTTTSTTSSLAATDLKDFIDLIVSYVNKSFPRNWN